MNRQDKSLEGAAFKQKLLNLVKQGGEAMLLPCGLMSELLL